MMLNVNISTVRISTAIISLWLEIQTRPCLQKFFDVNQNRFHVFGGIPMREFQYFHGGDAQHHGTLKTGSDHLKNKIIFFSYNINFFFVFWKNENYLDQRREKGIQIHGEIQLKLDIIIKIALHQLFKIFFQQTKK